MVNGTYFLVPSLAILLTIISVIYEVKTSFYSRKIIAKTIIYSVNFINIVYLFFNKLIDHISLFFGLLALSVSAPVSIYTIGYSIRKGYGDKLNLLIDVFALAMTYAFVSPNVLLFATAWTVAELLGFSLISMGEEHEERYHTASRRFLLVSTLTFELSVFTLIYVSTFILIGVLAKLHGIVDALTKPFWVLSEHKVPIPVIMMPLLLIGFITKAAIVPMHFWLPEAHSVAPSPASALLSGIMTSMGIYGLMRILSIISADMNIVLPIIIILCIISIAYGGLQSYLQRDCKRLLAYSTIAGMGFSLMFLSLYIMDPSNILYIALITSIMAHSLYKSTLFLNAGIIELTYGTRDIDSIRGYIRLYSTSGTASLIALLSLIGLPPTMGFISKLYAVLAVLTSNLGALARILALIGVVLIIVLSILIGLRYSRIYFGVPPNNVKKINDRAIFYPEAILASLNIISVLSLYIIASGVGIEFTTALVLISIPPIIILIYMLITIGKRVSA